jgi:hypothetical protein
MNLIDDFRFTLKAYNFYLFPENESDAIDFISKVQSNEKSFET